MTLDPFRRAVLGLAFATALVLAWEAASIAGVLSPVFFPAPSRALAALAERIASGALWPSLGATLLRMALGWLLAGAAGIALGAAIGSSAAMRAWLSPTLEFFRPLPASAIIPVAILFLGLSETMSLAVIAFGAVWPVLLGSVYGFAHVERRLTEVAAALEMRPAEYFMRIALPSALPDIVAGARVSLALALILAVVVEIQASLPGLGRDIMLAQRSFRSADLYAGLIVLGLVGYAASHVLRLVEAHVLDWRRHLR